ncbi:cytochrome C [Jannaschia sp. EhC01]|nr:cytochrome C [Jannaschia sp. EhC01]
MRLLALMIMVLLPVAALADHELERRDIENGRVLYATQCAACHGINLEGQPSWQVPGVDGILPAPPHDRTGHTWHHDNQLLFDYTYLGGRAALEARGVTDFNSGMMGVQGILTEDDVWDILAYIRSTWPGDVRAIQASMNRRHEEE